MARGGKRPGAGAKPKWKHGKTKTIRVPEVLADEVLDFARKLDENSVTSDGADSKILDLSGITVSQLQGRKLVYLSDLVRAGYEIMPLGLADMIRREIHQRPIRRSKTEVRLKATRL